MIRRMLLVFGLIALLPSASALAQKQPVAPPAISAEQAHAALDVLNDPKKRAAFAATLDAIIKAQSHTPEKAGAKPPAAAPSPPAEPPAAAATAAGIVIPLLPDSLGAQVLVSGSAFVSHAGAQTMSALRAVQSLPLLYGWAVVMVTNPLARGMLTDVTWRLVLALLISIGVEYALRRAMRSPIARLEAIAPKNGHGAAGGMQAAPGQIPAGAVADRTEAQREPASAGAENGGSAAYPVADVPAGQPLEGATRGSTTADLADPVARAEAGEVEPRQPPRRRPSAWVVMRRIPLVLGRLLLELVPILGLALAGHLFAGSSLGGQTVSRLVILAVIDAYAICLIVLRLAQMLLSPDTARLRLLHVPDSLAAYLMRWIRRLVVVAVFGYVAGEVGLPDVAHVAVQ